MRTGIATVPLDYGHCPRWLFERMKRLGDEILFHLPFTFVHNEQITINL